MNENERIEAFSKSVIRQANVKREQMLEKTRKTCDEMIARKKADTKNYERRIQSEEERIEQAKRNALLNADDDARKKVAEVRKKLTNQLFEEVETELKKFVESEEYFPWLLKLIETEQGDEEEITVLLNPRDQKYEAELKKKQGWTISFEDGPHLGGCKILLDHNRRMIDATLAVRLAEAQQTFYGFKNSEVG